MPFSTEVLGMEVMVERIDMTDDEEINVDFNDLRVGDSVKYAIGKNDRGPCAVDIHVVKAAAASEVM